ncbi:MAG TPA: SDR family oxidoreductase [Acidimicrobiales bacterium]|nr:SDR family oxidoreductase [Acidimicrobiales bacterium]
MVDRLRGKVCVVTGAGNGIGRACALRFAEEGAAVVVADLLDDAGEAVTAEIVAAGGRATYAHLDAASAADNERVAETAALTYGAVDVLVTAAGISHAGYRSGDVQADAEMYLRRLAYLDRPGWDLVEADVDEIRRVMDVNLVGTLLAIQSCGQRMLAAGAKGSIVTIASVAAKLPDAGPLGYVLSKAAVWMLTKKAARMLAPAGIRVNAIGPGFIDTNMTAVLDLADETREQILSAIPMGRQGTPADVANTALFLASDESAYFTGELLHPDGGLYTD